MAINPINNIGVYTSIMYNNQEAGYAPQLSAGVTKAVNTDTAIISRAARDLAAKLADNGAQEETNESEFAKIYESTTSVEK
jgi:hypothetical protein